MPRSPWILSLLVFGICALALTGDEFRPLWDGRSLDGWHQQGGGEWHVRDSLLVGTHSADEPRHGHLVTNQEYDDFTLRVRYRPVKGNSGLYFRAEEVGGEVGMHGFQAEIDPHDDPGGLYETGGRAWVVRPDSETVASHFRPEDWNTMKVRAHADTIMTWVNGTRMSTLRGDAGRTRGRIALQLHGNQDVTVLFSKIEIAGEPVN